MFGNVFYIWFLFVVWMYNRGKVEIFWIFIRIDVVFNGDKLKFGGGKLISRGFLFFWFGNSLSGGNKGEIWE